MKKSKLPSLVTILILTLITVVVWVSLDIYRLYNQPGPTVVPDEVSAPLSPTLDQESINELEQKIYLNQSQIPDNVINNENKPTEIPNEASR